jgi:hypothetical protein
MVTPLMQRISIWAGFGMMPLFFLGFFISGFIVPPAPDTPADQLATMFSSHQIQIRVGMFLATAGCGLLCFLFASIAVELQRMERGPSVLAYIQLVAGACATMEFIFPILVWQAAAYRRDRAPELIRLLNDVAWLPFLGITSTFIIQQVIIAVAIFRDKRKYPLPRWLAYLNLWAVAGIVPGSFVVFTHRGPVSWNGVLAWWVVVVAFFIWLCALCVEMHKSAGRWDQQTWTDDDQSTAAAAGKPTLAELADEVAALRSLMQAPAAARVNTAAASQLS